MKRPLSLHSKLVYSSAVLGSSLLLNGALALAAPVVSTLTQAPAFSSSAVPSAPTRPLAIVTGMDERTGIPTFLRASSDQQKVPDAVATSPEAAARWYLRHHADRYRLTDRTLATAYVGRVLDIGRGGLVVTFRQVVDGIDVYPSSIKVLMKRNLELVAISGNLNPAAVATSADGRLAFLLTPEEVITSALADQLSIVISPGELFELGSHEGGYRTFELADQQTIASTGWTLPDPARARPVFFSAPDRIIPAYYLEITTARRGDTNSSLMAYVIAADSGELLEQRALTDEAAFRYRVWAESSGDFQPLHGPQADYAPHPTGTPDGSSPAYISPVLISMEGFNHNPEGLADPWLAEMATESSGNNVDAYADHYDPDGFSDGDTRASLTGERTFDRTYDVNAAPLASADQTMAAVTQLFYTVNWLHDYYYDSGFDEAGGNGQVNNYGRGGFEADPLKGEGQDAAYAGSRNNANMSTPADGSSPRMQMYLWTGTEDRWLYVDQLSKKMTTGYAAFGPTNYDLSDDVVLMNDGTGTVTDGCTAPINDISGKIVLIDRGTCTFKSKTQMAETYGAVGVVIANHTAGAGTINMSDPDSTVKVNIPALSVSYEDGVLLKNQLALSPVTSRMYRLVGSERDGTIDNTIVAHEWGHYLHRRNVYWGTQQGGAESEGWADFIAAHMILNEGDNLDGTYAISVYAAANLGESGYYGIRRVPYSVDFSKNALTFTHIQTGVALPTTTSMRNNSSSNAEVHNAGEVWCTMVWEAYMALMRQTQGSSPRYSFIEGQRRMADYVVLGMALAPDSPTYTEQRDAILAAAAAFDDSDAYTMANAFARRGAGTCAVSPPRDSTDLVGVVESYELAGNLSVASVIAHEGASSCDSDGFLDGGESGHLQITLLNSGPEGLSDTQVTVSSSSPGISFPNGSTLEFNDVPPFGTNTLDLAVNLDDSFTDITMVDISVQATNSASCVSETTLATNIRVNVDETPNASATETVEGETITWTPTGSTSEGVWNRIADDAGNHLFHGIDSSSLSDTSLVSPMVTVSSTDSLTISFMHRYEFETTYDSSDPSLNVYWDGSVIEISSDGGASWTDISAYADPGYSGVITEVDAANPLLYREVYAGTNASWPDYDSVYMDLGSALAGQSIQLRLRIGTDKAAGAYGWELDNISFTGISNMPFTAVSSDMTPLIVWYADMDGDGAGDSANSMAACSAPTGYVDNADDCNDTNAAIVPGAPELCDGLDNDCDMLIDEDPADGASYYLDQDGDGYGDSSNSVVSCAQPDGYAAQGGDCDDSDPTTNPGSNVGEFDGIDHNCDGEIDDGPGCGSRNQSGTGLALLSLISMVGLGLFRRGLRLL